VVSGRRAPFWWLVAVLMLACGRGAGADTVLRVFAQAYTPEINTGDNPKPLHEFTRLAREFEKLHPGVRVEFLKNPVGEYRTWMRTQLQGGTAPEIMWAHTVWCNEDAKYGWFVALDPYLNKPNPYVKPGALGSKRWVDLFYPDQTNAKRAADGHLYSLPIDLVETGIFYNKDLFDRAGAKVPTTWAEWMEVHRKLERIGVIPFEMTGGEEMRLSWARSILNDQLWADKLKEMDVRSEAAAGFTGVDKQEFVRAYEKGIFSVRDPRYREVLRLLKEWSPYWQQGWLAIPNNGGRLFRLGKAAMWWDGSWYASPIERDPMRTFRFGIFAVPPLTRESSPYAPGRKVTRGVGGASSIQYAITNTAISNGKLDLAVEFIQFITAPQNLEPLVQEAALFIPNEYHLKGAPLLEPFVPVLNAGRILYDGEQASARYGDQAFRVLQGFLGGEYGEEETVNRLDRYLAVGIRDTLRENAGSWRFGEGWEILPAATPPPSPPPKRPWWVLAGGGVALLGLAGAAFSRPSVRRQWVSYAFILPTFVLLILFSYYPIFSALGHAFTEWKGSGEAVWTGLANFRELLRDDVMGEATWNVVRLMLFGVLVTLTVPLAVAEMIFALRSERAQYLYRVLFVIPMVVPGVVMLLIWAFIYDDNIGLLSQLLNAVGINTRSISWLGDPKTALYALMFIGFPWVGGFALLIYYAGLQNISTDVFDSARMDGAAGLRRFRLIDLPLLMGQIRLLVVLAFIGGIQGFQTQLLLTQGGPAYSTMIPGLHLYQNAITFDRMGYACAIGVVLFVAILGITYLNLKYVRSSTEYQP
jgi:raffinose/stachyose/melibiose transport system permease protein